MFVPYFTVYSFLFVFCLHIVDVPSCHEWVRRKLLGERKLAAILARVMKAKQRHRTSPPPPLQSADASFHIASSAVYPTPFISSANSTSVHPMPSTSSGHMTTPSVSDDCPKISIAEKRKTFHTWRECSSRRKCTQVMAMIICYQQVIFKIL